MRDARARPVFPVSLLAAGRRCLVVGGGKVALRKVDGLLAAQAEVQVVSPELDPALVAYVAAGRVEHLARTFEPADINRAFLVFAATDDPAVNRQVLAACREAGILACGVDGSWTDGDFVTPATLRHGPLTVAVSTGGGSCRRSKLVKESLARHVALVDGARLLVMGTSHHELTAAARGPFHLSASRLNAVGAMVSHVWGVHEFALLNTCNRVELIAIVAGDEGIEALLQRILQFDELHPTEIYVHYDEAAFEHVALLTAGLFSQTPGENHIVAQVKAAVAHAAANGWAAGILHQWLGAALHISKAIRNRIAPELHAQEIEELALDYLTSEGVGWSDAPTLVVGAGMIGRGVVEQLLKRGQRVRWFYHRNRPALVPGAAIEILQLEQLPAALGDARALICATASDAYVIKAADAAAFDPARPTTVLDLSMPASVDPQLTHDAPQIRVVGLDDLKHWYRREMAQMDRILELARQEVAERREMYGKLTESFQGRS